MFYDDIFIPTEVYPKKPLYEFEEWMGKEVEVKETERISLKPEGMANASEIVKVEAPNPEVLKMKERM